MILRIQSLYLEPSKVTLQTMESREKPEMWVEDDGAKASIGVDIYREKE